MEKIKCPICLGKGSIEAPIKGRYSERVIDLPQIAFTLKKHGYSYREIVKLMGLKHPGSISHLLSMYEANKNSTS